MQNKRNDHGVVGRKEFVKWHNYIICSTKLMLDVESNQNLFPISVCVSIQKNPTVDLGQHSFDSPATLIRLGFHAIRIFGGQASQPFPTNRLRMQVILCPFGWIKPIDKNGRIYRGTPKTGKTAGFDCDEVLCECVPWQPVSLHSLHVIAWKCRFEKMQLAEGSKIREI